MDFVGETKEYLVGNIEESTGSLAGTHSSRSSPTSFRYPEEITQDENGDDSEEEEFVYPGATPVTEHTNEAEEIDVAEQVSETEIDQPEVEMVANIATSMSQPPAQAASHPSPAQLEALCAAASTGDLELLQKLVQTALQGGDLGRFTLANDASSRTGFTPLHSAASRGHLNIVEWLIEACGAIPDLEDREGETALHKASLHGHIHIITYLLPDKADVHARDADGWTALHNACSQGYLDIVKWLCEDGHASDSVDGFPGVDLQSKGGWTPLMNAASKGHLPIVLYLLAKQNANPLVRNKWGETAFDVAAAVFEVWICELLQKSEAEKWHGSPQPYKPLAVHTTIPLVLFENQHLDTRLKALAMSNGRPRFSASGLGKLGRRAPFEFKLPEGSELQGAKAIPAWRSDVQLPLTEDPWNLPIMRPKDKPYVEGADRSHFWLCDWTLDVTHPGVDAEDGWQYSRSFGAPDENWTATLPPQIHRLLNSNGVMAASLGGSGTTTGTPRSPGASTWVRRRRWVRVMRRRLDIPPLPFLQPDGLMYHLNADGSFIRAMNEGSDTSEGQELMPMTATPTGDYLAHARYIVGAQFTGSESLDGPSPTEARRAITKLERALSELHQGIAGDIDLGRKARAQELLVTYNRELERQRLVAGSEGPAIELYDNANENGDDSDEEFHYPGSPSTVRTPSTHSNSTNYRNSITYTTTDLTSHLSRSTEFRVPTRETPQKSVSSGRVPSSSQQNSTRWERDDAVHECRGCKRRFGFLLRRHHCRRCGCIFCDRCSSHKALLEPSDVVHEPASSDLGSTLSSYRVCSSCHDEVSFAIPSRLSGSGSSGLECIVVDQIRLKTPAQLSTGDSNTSFSDFASCPVCNTNLLDLQPESEQTAHLKNCMDGGSGSSSPGSKYLVYQLPSDSSLLGIECVVCLDKFSAGSIVARLSCLCSFHNACLSFWLQRKRSCPVHAR